MEDYDGRRDPGHQPAQNLDEAFTRRIQFVVDFPFPDEAQRQRIWETHFPAERPVGADVDVRLAGAGVSR